MARRLLVLSTEFPPGPGGIGTHAWELCSHARSAGWDVTALTLQDYVTVREAEAFDVAQTFPVIRLESKGNTARRTMARLRAAVRVTDHLDPDIVVASGNGAVWLTALAPTIKRRGVVAVGHGMEFARRDRFSHFMNQLAYGGAAAVVCVSDYTRGKMVASGIHPRRAEVIPNGGDARVFRPADGSVRPYPDNTVAGKKTILTVGNVGVRKGQDVVVRALPRLVALGIDVHYVVVGLPTRGRDLIDLARQVGVADRVHVCGRVETDELLWAYQAADLFAMTSREAANGDFEGYGIAVLEAALCRTPAVVTDGSGLEEAVVHDETGLVVRQDDPAAFAEAAGRLLRDDCERAGMGEAARHRVLEHGTWATVTAWYLELFASLLDGDRLPT